MVFSLQLLFSQREKAADQFNVKEKSSLTCVKTVCKGGAPILCHNDSRTHQRQETT